MAKYYVPKEVYDSMTGVASNKNEYEYQKSEYDRTGGQIGAGYQKFSEQATPQYDVINAYSPELAANIKNMNAAQTRDFIKDYSAARNPKDIVKDIGKIKFGYETTKANGGDYKPYESQAFSLYEELNAVDPSLGAMVKNMNYNQINDYLNGKNPEVPVASQRTAYDVAKDILGFKQGYEGGMKHGVADFVDNHYQAQPYYDELAKLDPAMAAAVKGMNASELANYLETIKPKEPMDATGMYNAAFTDVSSSGNQFQNNLNTMYFDESYGQGVRDNFNRYGSAKGNQAAANAASANGGNFDSFADYNKNLTDMSYRIAGENAVQRMREGYANDYTNFLNVWGNQLIGNAKNFGDYEYNNKQLESNERIAKEQNDKDIYAIDKGYAAEVYGYNTNKEIAGMNNTSAETIENIRAQAQKDVAKMNADSANHEVDMNAATQKYVAGLNYLLGTGQITSDQYIAELNYGATIYGFDTDKYIAGVQAGKKGTSTSQTAGKTKPDENANVVPQSEDGDDSQKSSEQKNKEYTWSDIEGDIAEWIRTGTRSKEDAVVYWLKELVANGQYELADKLIETYGVTIE